MIMNYKIPPLEQKIIELYKVHRITKPEHLTVESLAAKFNVWVHYHHKKAKALKFLQTYILSSWISVFLKTNSVLNSFMNYAICSDMLEIKQLCPNYSPKRKRVRQTVLFLRCHPLLYA